MTVATPPVSLARRAAIHRALGDEHRLAIVDALQLSDRSPGELRGLTGLTSNLLAFHLDVLEEAGLVHRGRSQGDARRRYVTLRPAGEALSVPATDLGGESVVFVCTANAARSQLAAALWAARTGHRPLSAGTRPAHRVHPLARAIARRHGLDLSGATPTGYADLDTTPDLVVSVCDRAHESGLAPDAPRLHWSVADPADGDEDDFEHAFQELSRRVDRLATATSTNP